MPKVTTNLIIDGNAILYKYFFGYKDEPLDEIIARAHSNMLYKMQFLSNEYNVDNVVIVFDCPNKSWRKIYTSDGNPHKVTHKKYKAGRREQLSFSMKEKLSEFDDSIKNFIDFFKTQTRILCLRGDYLEGDDIIAGYVQRLSKDNHVIYSSDKDFLQLVNSIEGDVTLVEAQKDTIRSLNDWNQDPQLFLFEKMFRGEGRGGDNIQNAYPRLSRKKIIQAYSDDFLFNNIKNHEFEIVDITPDGEPISYKYVTGDLLKENKLLMDLTAQPDNIRDLINQTITDGINSIGHFNYMSFLKFCKRNGMEMAIKDKDKFISIMNKKYARPSFDNFPD